MKRLIVVLCLLVLSLPASAARMALEPQNRFHGGASVVDLSSVGVSLGLDSRLTRLIYIDVGGFMGASGGELAAQPSADLASEYVQTRHALWVAPGVRVPHRYGDGLKWDLFFRGGFGAVWSQDFSNNNMYLTNPAGLAGADFLVRKEALGVRLSGKMFGYRALPKISILESWPASDRGILSSQVALEAVYQW